MPRKRDDLAGRLRRALEGEGSLTAAVTETEERLPPGTPLGQLRELALYGASESVRLQAVKLLLERDEARRVTAADDDERVGELMRIVAALNPAECATAF